MSGDPLFARFGREFPAGDVLFREGDSGEVMFVIQSGAVRISKSISGEDKVLAVLGPGEFLGEMAILNGKPRTATATVVAPATEPDPQQNRGGRWQPRLACVFAPIGQGDGEALVFVAEAIFGVDHLARDKIALDSCESLPIAVEVEIGLGVDFLARVQPQRDRRRRELNITHL